MNKGDIGYFEKLKQKERIKCMIQFLVAILFLIVGFITTGTKLNLFTLVAILSCLPASKTLVAVIVKWKIQGISAEYAKQVSENTENLTVIYDAVLSSKEKIMPVDCLVISDNKIFGYTSHTQVDTEEMVNYMKNFLKQNQLGNINIKLFREFSPFISRVEGLNNMMKIAYSGTEEQELNLKHTILIFCM